MVKAMSKRSGKKFKRIDKDLYSTIDPRAYPPLAPFLWRDRISTFIDPCAGWGHMVGGIGRMGPECVGRFDILPRYRGVEKVDATALEMCHLRGADAIITNPPWSKQLLHPLIDRFATLQQTWLLFYSDWAYTSQASQLMRFCTDIVPVGRLYWIPGTFVNGRDNVSWYRFDKRQEASDALFHIGGRR